MALICIALNTNMVDLLTASSCVSFRLPNHVGCHSKQEPDELDDGDDAHPDAEAQQAPDGREEADPGLAGERLVLHHGGAFEVDLQDGDVILEGVISPGLKSDWRSS